MNSIKNFEMDFQNATLTFTVDGEPDESFDDFCDPTTFSFSETDDVVFDVSDKVYSIVSFQDDAALGCVSMLDQDGKPFYLPYFSFCKRVNCF